MALPINLLPWRHTERQRRRRHRISVLLSLVILLMVAGWGMWLLLHQQVIGLQKQGDELASQYNKLQEMLHQRQSHSSQTLLHQGNQRDIERSRRVARWGEILTELATKLPENSWLRSIYWNSGLLTLEGYTSEIEDLEKIEAMLKLLFSSFHIKAGPVNHQIDHGLTYTFILEE